MREVGCVILHYQENNEKSHLIDLKWHKNAKGPYYPKWRISEKKHFCPSFAGIG